MFRNDSEKKYIIIGLIIMILATKLIDGSLTETIIEILITIPGLVLAISVHEAAHAYTAYKLGDDTAKKQGRITLNPLKHLDIMGIISLLLFRIGWGKPVEYNPNKLTNYKERKKAEAKIALAGPIANFITSFILCIVYILLFRNINEELPVNIIMSGKLNAIIILYEIIMVAIFINIGLGVFNLIPFPPLDGSKVFYKIYEGKIGDFYERNKFILSIGFIILIFSGVISEITSPIILKIFELFMSVLELIF